MRAWCSWPANKFSPTRGGSLIDRWRLKLPQAGTIYRNLAVARFCRVFGTLLAGGVPIVRSLKISSDSTGNRILSAVVNDAADNITAGASLAAPLAASGQFPPNVVEMIAVAEQSNSLETVLADDRRLAGKRNLAPTRFVRSLAGAVDAHGTGVLRACNCDRTAFTHDQIGNRVVGKTG